MCSSVRRPSRSTLRWRQRWRPLLRPWNGISGDVLGALIAIKQESQNVSEYVTATAAAVEEQSVVTSEMSSSMQRAAAEATTIGR